MILYFLLIQSELLPTATFSIYDPPKSKILLITATATTLLNAQNHEPNIQKRTQGTIKTNLGSTSQKHTEGSTLSRHPTCLCQAWRLICFKSGWFFCRGQQLQPKQRPLPETGSPQLLPVPSSGQSPSCCWKKVLATQPPKACSLNVNSQRLLQLNPSRLMQHQLHTII